MIPIVSIVIPFFGLTNSILRIPKGKPQKELQRRLHVVPYGLLKIVPIPRSPIPYQEPRESSQGTVRRRTAACGQNVHQGLGLRA